MFQHVQFSAAPKQALALFTAAVSRESINYGMNENRKS